MPALRMTRNQMHDFLNKAVARCYNPMDSFTWKDYMELEFDLIPLDLSKYPDIKPETGKWINKLFDREDTDHNGNYMLRGFTGSDNFKKADIIASKLGMEKHYPSVYSWYGFNDEEKLVFTWCEGDMTLTPFATESGYEAEKKETINWYKEEYGS